MKNIIQSVVAVILLAVIAFALALKQSTDVYNRNREDEAKNGRVRIQE